MSLIIESYHGLYGVQYIKVIMIHKRSHNPMYDKSSTKTHYTNIRKLFILIAPIKTITRLILYCYVFIQPCLVRFKIIKSPIYIYTTYIYIYMYILCIYIYIHTYWLKHISSYCIHGSSQRSLCGVFPITDSLFPTHKLTNSWRSHSGSGCQRVHHIFYTTCKYNV
jgi:hypothetical protein